MSSSDDAPPPVEPGGGAAAADASGAGIPEGSDTATGSSITKAVAWLVLPPSILLAPLSAALYVIVRRTESYDRYDLWNIAWGLLDIGREANIAVWIASTFWLLIAALAALAALTAPRFRKSWWFFSAVAAIASADEAGQLHEQLFVVGDRLAPYVPLDLHYYWVVPGTIIALVVGALLLRLVLALRRPIALSIIGAGGLFLLGAVVMETLTGLVERREGFSDLYVTLMYIEEAFELLGVAWAITALAAMFRISRHPGGLSVAFRGFREPTA